MNLHGILKKGQGRRLFAVGAVAALGLAIGAAPSMASVGGMDNVSFCHATSAVENPYIVGITTDPDAIIGKTGHSGHTGDVFTPGMTKGWGDIIPAFNYPGGHYDGLNAVAGADFLANECKLPEGPHFSDLTLVKEVVNTGGGTELATAWTLDAVGTTDGTTAFTEGTGEVTHEVAEGTYTLSELPAATTNYTASAWDCTNTDVNGTTVTIGSEDSNVTCTITNTFIPPEPHTALLTLVKEVVNTGGGTELATAWTLDAVGTPEAMNAFAGGTTGVHQQVADGTYTLSELPAATTNYTASAWDCTNTTVNGTTVVIGPNDESVTCTITNTFVPQRTVIPDVPGISLVKSYTLSGSDALADATETISYSFLVTNTGNVALTSVAVVDLMAGVSAVSCPSTTLAVAATFTCTASYIVIPANVTGADIVNEANASGKPPTGGRVEATAFVSTPTVAPKKAVVAPTVITPAPEVAGVVKNAPVVAGVVKSAPVKTLAFTGAETVPLGLSGLLALLLGAVLTVASRQRPKQARE